MLDCVGYVFGKGLVFRIDTHTKKKEKSGERRGRKRKENRATFAVFNLLSGAQDS